MADSPWTSSPVAPFDGLVDVVALAIVIGLMALRLRASTRRWAPRGNARRARTAPAARPDRRHVPDRPVVRHH